SANIIFLEDNPEDTSFIKTCLFESGAELYKLTHVDRLTQAIQCLGKQKFDLILFSLSDDQGLDELSELRDRADSIPIVVLTNLTDDAVAIQLARLGVQDYLIKDQISGCLLRRTILFAIERAHFANKKLSRYEAHLQTLKQRLQVQMEKCTAELGQTNDQLKFFQTLSATDALTKLANRRYFEEFLELEWRRALRNVTPISVILIDIDQFKQFNDTYGHQRGDECLIKVSQTLQQAVKRPRDLVARYGGEEFIVILPDTPKLGATKVAKSIGCRVEALGVEHSASTISDTVTVSLGLSTAIPKQGVSQTDLIIEADQALYLAKHEGRNRLAYFHSTSNVMKFSDMTSCPNYGEVEVHTFE
ncbi:MAG: GGDEF domain-containing response regulator, partial [Leptolyngbyaceae cyanobacterium MO_188.B28]|nr:GGDEF domain-containing response regulator [Leptolyngbyaceae cyanobacterium MO_188.B28]